jgi:hypothetical protein
LPKNWLKKHIDIKNIKGYYVKNKDKNVLKTMEDEDMEIALIITGGVLGLFGIIFLSINKMNKDHYESENLKTKKEILELEVQKQNNQIKLSEEENRKYDGIINGNQGNNIDKE